MTRTVLFLTVFLGITLFFSSCRFSDQAPRGDEQEKITIFTLDTLLWIHAKMIAGNRGEITIASEPDPETLSSLQNSNIILGDTGSSESPIKKELQGYKGHYVTVPKWPGGNLVYDFADVSREIVIIRDALSDTDPAYRWYYHDNAGNYIHLLEEMNRRLLWRINEYHRAPFITIWGDFTEFIQEFGLEQHHMKHYDTPKNFLGDSEAKELIQAKNIQHVFIYSPITDTEIRFIEKEYRITLYKIAHLEDDTSSWWYLRFVEKIMNEFVRAFDTYD